jgi:tetratricopeptide (TPR) repeat protein
MLATTEVGASQSGLQGFWKALPLSEQTLQKRQVRLGPDHPSTLRSMNNLAVAYQAAGQLDKAVPLLERTLDKQKTNLRPDHPDTLNTMNNLAQAYQQAGRHDRAEPLLWELLEPQRKKTGPESPSSAGMLDRLGLNLLQESKILGGRLDPPRVSRHPGKEIARQLDNLQHTIHARWRPAGPEEVCRGRVAPSGGLRGDGKKGRRRSPREARSA